MHTRHRLTATLALIRLFVTALGAAPLSDQDRAALLQDLRRPIDGC
jgi:hypothetical protein